jgi:hypothetical protein
MTVRGTVSAGVEAGCLLFRPESRVGASGSPGTVSGPVSGLVAGGVWVLVGRTDGIEVGSTVTIRGSLAPGLVTTCQQGTPFRVDAVLPG